MVVEGTEVPTGPARERSQKNRGPEPIGGQSVGSEQALEEIVLGSLGRMEPMKLQKFVRVLLCDGDTVVPTYQPSDDFSLVPEVPFF